MPVVLPSSVWDEWLDVDNEDTEQLRRLLVPAPSESLHFWPVSTLVNKATNEGPELIEPIDEDEDEDRGAEEPVTIPDADGDGDVLQLDLLGPLAED